MGSKFEGGWHRALTLPRLSYSIKLMLLLSAYDSH